MNNEKKNIILAGTVAVVFLLGFLVNDPFLIFESSYEKSKPLISGNSDRVKKITVQDAANGPKKIFTKTTDGWTIELAGGPLGVQRADAEKINTGLKNLFETRKYQQVSTNKDKQGEFEVRDQDFQIMLEGENGAKIAQAVLGKFSGQGNASFIRLSDDTAVYAVRGFLRGDWNQEFDQYRDRTILRIAKENIKEIVVSGKQTLKLRSDEKGVLNLDPARATDRARVATYANDVSDLSGVKFFKEAALPPAYGKIEITLSANVTKQIEFFGPTKDLEFVVKSTDSPSPLVLGKSKVDSLFPRIEDLVEKNLMPGGVAPNK
jgi:hypothetical protein